jgi:hypothetical protein
MLAYVEVDEQHIPEFVITHMHSPQVGADKIIDIVMERDGMYRGHDRSPQP